MLFFFDQLNFIQLTRNYVCKFLNENIIVVGAMSNTYHIAHTVMYHHRLQRMLTFVDHRACIITHVSSMCKHVPS